VVLACEPATPPALVPPPTIEIEPQPAAPTPPSTSDPPPPADDPALRDPALANERAPEQFDVRFETTRGAFVVACTRAWAPHGVDRFYNLVRIGYVADVAFFRVARGFVVHWGIHGDPRRQRAPPAAHHGPVDHRRAGQRLPPRDLPKPRLHPPRPPPVTASLRRGGSPPADCIACAAAHIDSATHELLVDIYQFDANAGWAAQGAKSCAHWLSWRIGVGLVAAREQVRVARALTVLPLVAGAMQRGELSYAKVRAITRVATSDNEQLLLDLH
jgi:hypothetical protein